MTDQTVVSPWVEVSQDLINQFAQATLDPDPLHIDPTWAREHAPFGGPIAFGFLTLSLLSHLYRAAKFHPPDPATVELNYGFERVRMIAPVRSGKRIRGHFAPLAPNATPTGLPVTRLDCRVEIEGEPKPALQAIWLIVKVPASGHDHPSPTTG